MKSFNIMLVVVMLFIVGTMGRFNIGVDFDPFRIEHGPAKPVTRTIASDTPTCNGQPSPKFTKASKYELSNINILVQQVNFDSIFVSTFKDVVRTVVSVPTKLFQAATDVVSKVFFTHKDYRLVGDLKGAVCEFRIETQTRTYGAVVVKVGKPYGAINLRKALTKSCNCGQKIVLD